MNRRSTLATLIGKKTASAETPIKTSLSPYTGPWNFEQVAHLLRRTTFGANATQIAEMLSQGLDASIETLFADIELPEPPINYYFEGDSNVPIGASWVEAPYIADGNILGYRNRSLRAWQLKVMMEEPVSIREKLCLFWHNHFAVANINDPKFFYKHISLIRTNAWGNFRELIKEMIIDPAMLRFLNGNQNTKESPNENFARELLELYTIGKGPLAGPGDYTNYTEQDVREVARALTGWRDVGYLTPIPEIKVGAFYRPFRHDTSPKNFSHRFDGAILENGGQDEYKDVVDLIFAQKEVARFISRKLYRWFIYYKIDEQIEIDIIEPMADLLLENDYEIKPVLQMLLKSEHFFDALNIGPYIKNPYDFSINLFRTNDIALPEDIAQRYEFCALLFGFIGLMEMEYFNPPSVAGWKAYYQEPAFYRIWINSSTLRPRMLLTDIFSTVGFKPRNAPRIVIDVFEIINNLKSPADPNALITELAQMFFPQALTENQLLDLKEVLIPGLPDFEWTVEYNEFLSSPDDQNLRASVEAKLRTLLRTMLIMPEYYLS